MLNFRCFDEASDVSIIQGVAGSGKTSIALHRIAFLLYRFKDTLTSKDILIISPNKVFADYISNVLPEFGEESMQKHRGMAVAERTRKVAQDIEHNIDIYQHYELTKEERADLRASLKKMQKRSTLCATYKNFFTWMGKPELFKLGKYSILEYSDVFPLVPFSSSTTEKIQRVFRQAECVKLCKSYRSTYEITRFAQRISPNL